MVKQQNKTTKDLAVDAKSLNKSLLEVFNVLKENPSTLEQAKELANVAGKIIKLNLGRMEYKQVVDSKKSIDFWEE